MVIVFWLSINSKKDYDITIYYKVYSYFSESIGYKNSYGHEVIAIQRYSKLKHKFVTINNFYENMSEEENITLKEKIINRIINSLEKLKKR